MSYQTIQWQLQSMLIEPYGRWCYFLITRRIKFTLVFNPHCKHCFNPTSWIQSLFFFSKKEGGNGVWMVGQHEAFCLLAHHPCLALPPPTLPQIGKIGEREFNLNLHHSFQKFSSDIILLQPKELPQHIFWQVCSWKILLVDFYLKMLLLCWI